jgi:hypothetical protein
MQEALTQHISSLASTFSTANEQQWQWLNSRQEIIREAQEEIQQAREGLRRLQTTYDAAMEKLVRLHRIGASIIEMGTWGIEWRDWLGNHHTQQWHQPEHQEQRQMTIEEAFQYAGE